MSRFRAPLRVSAKASSRRVGQPRATGNQRAVSDDASCGTLYAGCGAGQALQVAAAEDGTVRCTPATQPWMCRAWSAQTPRQPAEPGQPWAAPEFAPPLRARRLGGAAAAPLHFAGRHLDGAAGALLHAAVARALLLDLVAPALLRARAPVLRLRLCRHSLLVTVGPTRTAVSYTHLTLPTKRIV